jgi:hypothetical protein
LLALCLVPCFAACSSTTTATTIVRPTLIAVAPADFLGSVPCSDEPGGMQSYVATLYDITPTAEAGPGNLELPSSPPTPCSLTVTFSWLYLGHQYAAQIDGYDRSDLHPIAGADGGAADGARTMVDPNGAIVPPHWTTNCGYSDDPVVGFSADGGIVDAGQPSNPIDTVDSGILPSGAIAVSTVTTFVQNCAPLAVAQSEN